MTTPRIKSIMAKGNGAYIIHKTLEKHISNYNLIGYNPYQTLFPPYLYKHTFGTTTKNTDLIHTTPDYGAFSHKNEIPLIITFHNFILDHFMEKHSSLLQKIHYKTDLKHFTYQSIIKASKITAVSKFTANLVKDFYNINEEIDVIYNGVDTSLFTPSITKKSRNKIRILFAGNLTKRKGVEFLPKIIAKLNKNISISCTGGLRKNNASNIDLSSIEMLGNIPFERMPEIYPEFDILLFPTIREGFGLVATEAMACGLPVVATDCSSLPELINHEKGGYLCELGNAADFASKLNLLATSPKIRQEMGEYNRSKVESEFNLQDMITKYNLLFEEVMDNK